MKTDFPIAWIDDNKDFVESLKAPLGDWIEDQGFGLKVSHFKNSNGFVSEVIKNDQELVIIDLNLPGKKNGDALIAEIRANGCWHDIVFYSHGGIPHGVFSTPPDGVFFVDRTDAKQRIKELIGLKIKRASDIATLRGWIVADAIELEHQLGAVLSKCFRDFESMFNNCVLAHEGLFDCGKKHMVLNNVLKTVIAELDKNKANAEQVQRLRSCKLILDKFTTEVIHVRNALAHQIAADGASGKKAIQPKGHGGPLELTEANCAKIRKNLRKHEANLADLLKLV
jgi:hypothetical protein